MMKKLDDPQEIRKAVEERIQTEKSAFDRKEKSTVPETEATRYFIEDGYLCRHKTTRDGKVTIRLCNFTTSITEENILDDGAEINHFYTLEGKFLYNDHPLPRIEVPANNFAGMSWIHKYGSKAILEPGQTVKDFVRHAIQTSSNGISTKTHFAHTGWREVDGKMVYLHAAGAIGNGGDISIKLPKELMRYTLPPSPPEHHDSEKKALEASLSFLDIGDRTVMVPLFCSIYLSPLTTLLNPIPNFSVYLYGQSGTFKSTLAVLALAHFGTFTGVGSLSNLDDSVANLEKRLFILKDTLAVIDDYYPSHRKVDAQGMEYRVQRLIRNQANRTARGRMTPDMTEKPRNEPRGMLLITGEELPGLESTLARIHVIEVTDQAVNKNKLTELQRQLPLLSVAMSSYIAWLRENLSAITQSFPERFIALREKAAVEGFHRKLPEQVTFLKFALEVVASFITEKNVMTDAQASELVNEGWQVFKALAERQQQRITADDPIKLFVDILSILVAQSKVRINHTDDGENLGAGNLIGFYDSSFLYLYPTAAWHELNTFLQKESGHYPFSRNTFTQMLRNRKILQPSPSGENTTFIKVKGKSHRVIKIIDQGVYKTVTSVTP